MAGSGFQLDSNQLTPGLYGVTLTMSTSNYPAYSSGSTTTLMGAVNPYDWTSSNYTNATSLSAAQATVLAQGNLRWQSVLDALDGIADCRILDVVVSGNTGGTDATTAPTSVSFTVAFDRDEFILGEWNNYLKSQGQSANGTFTASDTSTQVAYTGFGGTAITTVALALKDLISNAISGSRYRLQRVYNPAQAGDSESKVSITAPNTTYATIYGTVAVSQISGTTLLSGSPL
jgi:hypothetical protein